MDQIPRLPHPFSYCESCARTNETYVKMCKLVLEVWTMEDKYYSEQLQTSVMLDEWRNILTSVRDRCGIQFAVAHSVACKDCPLGSVLVVKKEDDEADKWLNRIEPCCEICISEFHLYSSSYHRIFGEYFTNCADLYVKHYMTQPYDVYRDWYNDIVGTFNDEMCILNKQISQTCTH